VAIRMCPHCGKTVPATRVMALSDGMECPHCQTRLQVAPGSRMVATAAGLIAAWLVWRFTQTSTSMLGFALQVLYAVLAFGIVSPVVLAFSAGLRTAPVAQVYEPVAAHGTRGHAVPDHAGGHH
jgi:DNA-directed RNA polymerase subunit RPC12/RpoP